jgi:peptidoglycan/LPS O-acetylase OafA/YrhL
MPQLYFTRFIFAFFIVVFHFGNNISIFDNTVMKYFLSLAPAGVNYFFLLSGFVLTFVYNNTKLDKRKFYLKRFLYIYPPYLIALLMLVIFFLWTGQAVNLKAFLVQTFLLQAWFPTFSDTLNVPGWAVSVEVFFYICFSFLLINLKRVNKKWLLFAMALIFWVGSSAIYQFYSTDFLTRNFSYIYINPLLCLNFFIIGIISYLLFVKDKKIRSVKCSIVLLCTPLIIFPLIIFKSPWVYYGNFSILTPLFVSFLVGLTDNNTRLAKIFSNKHLVSLGKISYEIYILQGAVFVWWSFFFNKVLSEHPSLTSIYRFHFFGFFLLLLFIAWSYFKLIKVPIQKRLNGIK